MRSVMILLAVLLMPPVVAAPAEPTTVRVFRVLDGDTLLVRTRAHSQRVQLAGIDAPELDQPGGQFSLKVLEKMVRGQRVQITVLGENAAGDPLVTVRYRQYDIPLEMVRAGAAWAGPDGGPALRAAQAQAQADGLGIWSREGAAPVAPWEWRSVRDGAR